VERTTTKNKNKIMEVTKMANWTYDEKDILELVSVGGSFLNKSGCYDCKLTKVEFKDNSTGSKSAVIGIETSDGAKKDVYITHTKADGTAIDFNVRKLNHLCYLLKAKPDDLVNKIGSEIGCFVKVKASTTSKFPDVQIDGFYDIKSKKVPKEIKEGTPAEVYGKFEKTYSKDVEIGIKSDNTSNTAKVELVEDDEFPF